MRRSGEYFREIRVQIREIRENLVVLHSTLGFAALNPTYAAAPQR